MFLILRILSARGGFAVPPSIAVKSCIFQHDLLQSLVLKETYSDYDILPYIVSAIGQF